MSVGSESMSDDEWMTPRAVSRHVKVSRQTIYRWAALGQGPPRYKTDHTRNAAVRYRRSEVDAWLDSQRVPQDNTP